MKEERFNMSNQQTRDFDLEARLLRSRAISRLTGEFLRAPVRQLKRFSAFKIESATPAVEIR